MPDQTCYTDIQSQQSSFDVSTIINVTDSASVATVRDAIIDEIWITDGELPSTGADSTSAGQADPVSGMTNVDDTIELTITVNGNTTKPLLVVPSTAIDVLVIVHAGHSGNLDAGLDEVIRQVVEAGCHCLICFMPSGGTSGHDTLGGDETGSFNPMEYFIAPTIRALTYALTQVTPDKTVMVGLSGGGWTADYVGALDTRIDITIPVAASLPMYIRDVAGTPDCTNPLDWEQQQDDRSAYSMVDLYLLGAHNRTVVQVHNKFDSCCNWGITYQTYEDDIDSKMSTIGGDWSHFIDTGHSEHKISDVVIDNVIMPQVLGTSMTFPAVQSVTETQVTTPSTTHNVDLPSTVNAGDLLLIFITLKGVTDSTPTRPSGWREVYVGEMQTTDGYGACYARNADGTEDSGTVNVTTPNSYAAAAQVYRITGWHGGVYYIEASARASGLSTDANPDACTPTWGSEDTLWIAVAHCQDDDATVSAYPTGYSGGTDTISGAGTNAGATVGTCYRELQASTENPNTYTMSESEAWAAFTVAVRTSQSSVFAVVEQVVETQFNSSGTSHDVLMPDEVDAGDLLLIFITLNESAGSEADPSTPAGWTELYDVLINSSTGHASCYVKIAAGTEDGTTVDVTTTNNTNGAAHAYRVTGWYGDLAGVEDDVGTNSGTATADPPSVTASWGSAKNLWIAAAHGFDDDATASAYPSGYAGGIDTVSGAGLNDGGEVATAQTEALAATEDPGAFTWSESESTAAFTVVVRPAVSVMPLPYVAPRVINQKW